MRSSARAEKESDERVDRSMHGRCCRWCGQTPSVVWGVGIAAALDLEVVRPRSWRGMSQRRGRRTQPHIPTLLITSDGHVDIHPRLTSHSEHQATLTSTLAKHGPGGDRDGSEGESLTPLAWVHASHTGSPPTVFGTRIARGSVETCQHRSHGRCRC